MKVEQKNGLTIKVWDSVEELPIENYKLFQLYLMIDAGVGADFDAIDKHHMKLANYIERGDKKEALGMITNIQQSYAFILSQSNPRCVAFTCLVHSVDGKEWNDLSPDGSKRLMKMLSGKGFTWGWLNSILDAAKKKIKSELLTFFPQYDSDDQISGYYKIIKKRSLAQLESIIQDKPMKKKISKLESDLVAFFTPLMYGGSKGVEVKEKLAFANMATAMNQHIHKNVLKMTTLEFINSLLLLDKQFKKMKK